MNAENLKKALEELKSSNKPRKFTQSYELVFNLKDLDLKKPENQVDLYVELKEGRGKKAKICALVGPELKDEATRVCDKTISQSEFDDYKDKKQVKKLAAQFDFFIAQATIMPKIAQYFGRALGPRKKMPNPKAGCVVQPKIVLDPLYKRLQDTVRLFAKDKLIIQCPVGCESMPDEKVIENIQNIYNQLIHKLPSEQNNIRSAYIKLTMSKAIKVM